MYNFEINGNNLLVTLHVDTSDAVTQKQIADLAVFINDFDNKAYCCECNFIRDLQEICRIVAQQPPANSPKVNLDTTGIDEAIAKTDELLLKLRSAQALIHNLSNKEF